MDYSKTLHLPETDFPMRGNLPKREPGFVKMWKDMDLYHQRLEKRRKDGAPAFVLHDGPPYANGKIHIGHALNKTLKDIIVRYKFMKGYAAHYVPGWDTHGLPIEYAVLKESGEDRATMTPLQLREKCLAYAKRWINIQREDFIRMGVVGDFEHPYVTFDPHLEAKQLEVFGAMADKGYIYKGKKAVYWCPHCETALAEAEIEYKDRKSPSIYVKFPALDVGDLAPEGVPKDKLFAVIWTTTPWTIPANEFISVNPKFTYVWVHNLDNDEYYLMNKELAPAALADCKVENYEFAGREMLGAEWDLKSFQHPLYEDRVVYVLEGNHVTLDAGTGCVHTAPGHGVDDFEVYKSYENAGKLKQEILCPVDEKGRMTEEAGLGLVGKTIWEAEGPVISLLAHAGRLLGKKSIHHQYAHCWRCKNPIIYRATEQWFASINDFRDKALKAVDDTTFYPAWGHDRLYNMIRDRQDWCISRQRSWGVPIPAFYCDDCGKYVITHETTQKVVDIVEKEGSDAWWKYSAEELLPEGFTCPHCGGHHFHKEKDIMDVWFDSGSTWNGVLKNPREEWKGAAYPCDLYLEGSDQHRGWFHSSLLTSVAVNGHAPYKAVLTHGFTMDGEGRKMSKSVGNVVAPQDIINKYGADVMRLWISSVEYQSDVRLSDKIIKSMSDVYRKIRNTFRYLLGNLADFNPATDAVPYAEMDELDRWALLRLEQVKEEVSNACEQYQFHVMYHAVHNFCTVDLSATYLDILKDRLYTETADSRLRRSAQTAMYEILDSLVRIMAPFICFTAEEVWQAMPAVEGKEASVHLADWPAMKPQYLDSALDEKWSARLALRSDVMKALENARAAKIIGHPLDADVTIYAEGDAYETLKAMGDFLSDFFIVSNVELVNDTSAAPADALTNEDGVCVSVAPSTRQKCERCWKHLDSVGSNPDHPDVCARCARVLDEEKE
ncbi:MAG: isoleucine--tRNA ligase [Allisonella histaminiformans]|uniref:isoleucine--tRNA ligase n=1 Tax=Allisonella histaminiformans TaxID=209880 RepID=UPI002A8287AD|nr:isoleucine--tRNA ligase [Allisonella histaminiformans]MDY3957823.1 isoleucine--tRNA ligase [Allisonella histaminiformans]